MLKVLFANKAGCMTRARTQDTRDTLIAIKQAICQSITWQSQEWPRSQFNY